MLSTNSRQLARGPGDYKHERDRALESRIRRSTAMPPPETTGRSVQYARHEEQLVLPTCDYPCANRTTEALNHVNHLLEMEVKRIAHALHDEAGHTLTLVHLKLAEIERQARSQCTAGFIEVRQLLDGIEEQLGQLSRELPPVILDEFGLVPALESLADNFGKRTGLDIAVIAATRERFPAPLEIALYRTVQEALINANRHAKARRITVEIRVEAGMVHCCVSDDGAGFNCETARGGLGLLGIRERLAHLGGRLTITSRIGEGTRIAVDIPMEKV